MIPTFVTYLDTVTPSFTTVENARLLQPEDSKPENLPALFAFRDMGEGGPSRCGHKVSQKATRIVSVYLVCSHLDHEALELELFNAVLGWQFTPEWQGMEYQDDKVVSIAGNIIWHQYNFSTWHTIRQT